MSNNQSNGNSGQSQQNTGSNGQSNNGRENSNQKPMIPDEIGNPDCPICLCRVENRAYTNTCLHEFCFECIKEWSESHNSCPVCRIVYQKILYNIRSKQDYDEEEVAVPFDLSNGLILDLNGIEALITPPTGIYLINPFHSVNGLEHRIEYFGGNRIVFGPFPPDMVRATPDRLEQTLQEMNARIHHPHHGYHPNWLMRHPHHSRHRHNP